MTFDIGGIIMHKEGKKMAVLTKPLSMAFELDPQKADAFFNNQNAKGAFKRAMERSAKHPCKANVKKEK